MRMTDKLAIMGLWRGIGRLHGWLHKALQFKTVAAVDLGVWIAALYVRFH